MDQIRKKNITLIIPVYNEEEVIEQFYKRVSALSDSMHQSYRLDFLFVNDGSSDQTLQLIKNIQNNDKRVGYVNLSRNFGKEIAMIAGFDAVNADAVVVIDADLQDPPELVKDMIVFWEQGYDDVYARRRSRSGETYLKKITSAIFYRILQSTTRIPIQQDTGDFRLLDKRCIESLKMIRESQRYTKGMFSWIGYKKKEFYYDRDPRAAGKTKWNYARLFNLAVEGITSFTTVPLRISSLVGLLVSMGAFVYIFIIVTRTIIFGSDLAGYPSVMAVLLFLGGIQLLSIGIIGEYVGRIFIETKNRPLYFVDEINIDKN